MTISLHAYNVPNNSSGNLLNTVRHLFHFLNSDNMKKVTTLKSCYHNNNKKRKHLLLASDQLILGLVNTSQSVPFKHTFLSCQKVEKGTEKTYNFISCCMQIVNQKATSFELPKSETSISILKVMFYCTFLRLQ